MHHEVEATIVLISFCTLVVIAGAQSSMQDQGQAQETQVSGYWVDPSTGLMWARKDNGKDVNWHKAMKYCRNLRLAGYSDWRLATLGELVDIYDKSAEAPGENPRSRWHEAEPLTFHVKGGLFLTGKQWRSNRRSDDRGHPSGYGWYFDFNEGRADDSDELGFDTNKRALCLRRPGSGSLIWRKIAFPLGMVAECLKLTTKPTANCKKESSIQGQKQYRNWSVGH